MLASRGDEAFHPTHPAHKESNRGHRLKDLWKRLLTGDELDEVQAGSSPMPIITGNDGHG
jgi:hypothetical protein